MWKKIGQLLVTYLPTIVQIIIDAQAKKDPNKLVAMTAEAVRKV